MIKNRQNIITKYNPHPVTITEEDGGTMKYMYEFTMYRTHTSYDVPFFRYRGLVREGHVDMETYGLVVHKTWFEGEQELKLDYDLGALSAQQYQVSALLHFLCRYKILSVDKRVEGFVDPDEVLSQLIRKEAVLWNRNDWGNPFGKVAEGIIKDRIRKEESIIAPVVDDTDIKQKKDNPFIRLAGLFKSTATNGRGEDM